MVAVAADPTNMLTFWGECPCVTDGPSEGGSLLVFRDTDVPVAGLFTVLRRNGTVEDFLDWCGHTVSEQDVRTVLDFLAAEAYRPSRDIYDRELHDLATTIQDTETLKPEWLQGPYFDRTKQWGQEPTTDRITDWSACLQTNRFRGKVSGQLVIYDTRMPVGHLLSMLRDNFPLSEFLEWFHEGSGLEEHDVAPILEFLETDLSSRRDSPPGAIAGR